MQSKPLGRLKDKSRLNSKYYLKNLILCRQPENGDRILRSLIKDMKATKTKPLPYTKRNIYVIQENNFRINA